MRFTICEAEMNIVEEVKKCFKSSICNEITFRNRASEVTLGEIDKIWKMGFSITRKKNHLIVRKEK